MAYEEPRFERLFREQDGRCFYCTWPIHRWSDLPERAKKRHPAQLATEDHRHPRSKGGRRGDNIVLACRACNNQKGSGDEAEFLKSDWLRRKRRQAPPRPEKNYNAMTPALRQIMGSMRRTDMRHEPKVGEVVTLFERNGHGVDSHSATIVAVHSFTTIDTVHFVDDIEKKHTSVGTDAGEGYSVWWEWPDGSTNHPELGTSTGAAAEVTDDVNKQVGAGVGQQPDSHAEASAENEGMARGPETTTMDSSGHGNPKTENEEQASNR